VNRLIDIIRAHFDEKGDQQTRVMVFSQLRASVEELVDALRQADPARIRPMMFIGQSSGRGKKGLAQKDQIRVVDDFRSGGYNVLVSTSIGEEGLDIGEVDLIVLFDSQNSPTRMLQRMGRTGRQRKARSFLALD